MIYDKPISMDSSNSNVTNVNNSTSNNPKQDSKTTDPGGGSPIDESNPPTGVVASDTQILVANAIPKAAPTASASNTITTTTATKPISHKLNDINLQQIPTEELLGSVTTFYPSGDAECGHALRTSARVIHKMRMDSIRGSTPPPQDRKDGGTGSAGGGKIGSASGAGSLAKTPNQQKQVRMVWSNQDKNLFFEALNECGKDFEGIVNYLNTKKRRKDINSEHAFKVKDVRHLYYQFNQKVSKYLHFSDEVKKEAQELYGLINYGEMRKKAPFQNKKYFHKLKDLVYKGWTTIREKGRNIRIKTPSCRALRKINQLEEWQEEIKLPPRVDVILKPATVGAWGRVQSLAQNPRVRTSVTLQKRLSTLLQLLQQKWRHQDIRLGERISGLKATSANITSKTSRQKAQHELELCTKMTEDARNGESQKILCFTPSKEAVIHRPMINLAEFLSSYSICLNSYEQRIGAKVRGEVLCAEKLHSFKERMGASSKRQRHDSGSEKHSPDGKKVKSDVKDIKEEKVGDCVPAVNFVEVFKSPNASNESIDLHIESSDGEGQPLTRPCVVLVKAPETDIFSDDADLKSPESNDSMKFPGLSKLKEELDPVGCSTGGENSNDGAVSECDQPKPLKMEEVGESTASEDLIKTTVKRKESKERCGKRKDSKAGIAGLNSLHFRPLISEETIQKIREGWTSQNVGDLTVGDLYIMFGEENKLFLEYCWVKPKENASNASEGSLPEDNMHEASCSNATANVNVDTTKSITYDEINLSERLKQLLQIANLNEKTGKRRCPCGHVCDRRTKIIDPLTSASNLNDNLLFKQPMVPMRNNPIATLANCNVLPPQQMRYKQSRWWRMRVNRQQVPSQRVMLSPNGFPCAPLSRTNNNNYPGLTKLVPEPVTSMVSSTQNYQVASSSNGSKCTIATASSSCSRPENDDDQVTKLLEDKISSFSSASQKPTIMGKSVSNATDDSCLSLFDVSLPSTSSTLIADLMSGSEVSGSEQFDDGESSCSTTLSATRILRESPVDGRLIETDINDISLSSFLGHLDAVYESEAVTRKRDSDMNISIISESSVDYIARFEDIAAQLRAQQEQDSV
ncbi:protein cramped [Topomyia yanbarensis]|uniref:protein cramped n=1 Tax=Topomyia yanbarensis TaxID=2498891 RepID=UPI00273AAA8A|nr:protein cramped [Topomyia yanbarensis]